MKIKQTNAGKNFLFNFQNKNDKNSCTFYINFLWTWNSSIWVRYIIVCWNNTTLELLNFFCFVVSLNNSYILCSSSWNWRNKWNYWSQQQRLYIVSVWCDWTFDVSIVISRQNITSIVAPGFFSVRSLTFGTCRHDYLK